MRPVEDLTLAAEHVAETQDLIATIDDTATTNWPAWPAASTPCLPPWRRPGSQQAQLVSDAGHELRTPLTSLRTNIEVLMRAKDLAGADREELLADVDAQLKELTTLVGDLVDLAREDERTRGGTGAGHVQRDRRPAPSNGRSAGPCPSDFDVSLQPGQVRAQPALLERAVMNVLDNAAKWSPPRRASRGDAGSQQRLAPYRHRPGPWDRGRGPASYFRPVLPCPDSPVDAGSGLGLAIVKGVVTSHGGTIDVGGNPTGGTRVDIVLPMDGGPSSTRNGEATEL